MTTIKLKNSTVAGHAPTAADLVIGELALNSADGKAFMKLNDNSVKELTSGSGPTPPPITPWVRNPTWLPMPARTSADEVVDLLVAIYPESNYFALNFTCVGGYNVTWGDGVNQGYASATVANYQYDYNDPDIVDTNGPVTFDSATSTVNRTAHGYTDGMTISFATITTTTGIIQNQQYYVVNATANTFQVSDTVGGTALFLIGNGTGAILPYKQVLVRVIPITPGNLLTNVNLQVKNTTTGLNAYAQPILDATISAGCTTLAIGSTSASVCIPKMMERCTILRHNDTTIDSLFSSCSSLQSVPLFNTTNVTTMANMFNGCTALQSVPLFDTTNVASMLSMFKDCFALVTVPLFDTTNVTNMTGMFTSCVSLQSVPLFNTGKVTIMGGNTVGMFSGCFSLQSVPLFDTTNVTNMQQMFISCNSLQTVPLFNTAKVTTMTGMFSGCASLQTVPLFNTANVTLMTSMFNQCYSLQSVPLFDTAKVTDMINMFTSCNSLISVPLFNTANVTTMGSMFSGCFSLKSVPLFDTSKVTSFSNMFNQCTSLQSVPAFDTTAVTGTTAFSTMFSGCSSLQQVPDMNFNRAAITTIASYTNMFTTCPSLSKIGNGTPNTGPKFTFSVASCKLSAASLNALYTSLPTVSGQTITVTGNVGTAGDDPSIAVGKGWVVTGS